jgi:DNA segregation ATPase FtsK/SpoIIIE, S-DNA-T family
MSTAARTPGTAVEWRPSAELAIRPAAEMDRSRPPVRGRRVLYATVRQTARRAVPGRRARAVVRWLLRNSVLYLLTGAWVLVHRGWDARTNARYERQMRAAEAAGDQEKLTDWEARADPAREQRHRRRMDWITAPIEFAHTAAALLLWLTGGLLGLGAVLAVAHSDLTWVLAPLNAVVQAVAWLAWLVDTVWRPVLVTLAVLGVAGVWQVGRLSGRVPGWAAPARARVDATVVITPGGIAARGDHLGVPALTRAIKDGWQVEFSTPPVRVNRRSYQTVFSLPMGVTPEMIADKRDVLARNLVRAPLEVWPATAEHAGYVDLWVADPGSTERAAPPCPLLKDGRADVFDGVPVGVSQRGDVITLALPGANLVYRGLMGQGKSNAARVTLLGAALDPLAVLWVFVFANNGDFDAYRPRLARYHRGVDDDVAAAALDGLRELYGMVSRREARLADLGAKKVTRVLAERHPELRPTVALFSECHELFGHPVYGREAADLAV